MNDGYKQLENEECCYTCEHNRNNLSKEYPCNCEFKNKRDHVYQDEMACDDYKHC